MIVQRSVVVENPRRTMIVGIGDIPTYNDPSAHPMADYDALAGTKTLEVSIEPMPSGAAKVAFAKQIGAVAGVGTMSVEWGVREEPDGRTPSRPVARVSFGDKRGWDKERVMTVLNAAQIICVTSLARL